MQLGKGQAHQRASEELQREAERARHSSQEVRTERDSTARHETDSRLLMIKVRNLDGAASPIQVVMKVYHVLDAREERTAQLKAPLQHSHRPGPWSLAGIPHCGPWPGQRCHVD